MGYLLYTYIFGRNLLYACTYFLVGTDPIQKRVGQVVVVAVINSCSLRTTGGRGHRTEILIKPMSLHTTKSHQYFPAKHGTTNSIIYTTLHFAGK